MHGVVSLLPEPFYGHVEKLWDELETNFGSQGIRTTPLPHFSWQIGDKYNEQLLLPALDSLADQIMPFDVTVKGAEFFISQQPVVFLKVIKDATLLKIHLKIWKTLLPLTKGISMLYSPPLWRPHISLAYQDLAWRDLKTVLTYIKTKGIEWNFKIDNLSFGCQSDNKIGKLKYKVKLNESFTQ